jgi:hypothetical protein
MSILIYANTQKENLKVAFELASYAKKKVVETLGNGYCCNGKC